MAQDIVTTDDNGFSIDEILLEAAIELGKALDKQVENFVPSKIADIIKFHSKGAAVSAVAAGWVPGAGSTIAVTISAGFIWTMYAKINNAIGLKLSDNILKTLASGVATNLMAAYAGGWLISTALSLIPGLGSLGASAIIGATCYALTLASGYVYLKIMTELLSKEGKENLQNLTQEELKKEAEKIIQTNEVEEILTQAKKEYKHIKG